MKPVALPRALPASLMGELPRIVLVGLFGYAAVDKLMDFPGFVIALEGYHFLPAGAEFSAAIFFVMAEFAIALGLLTKRWRRPACVAAVLLLGAVTALYLASHPAGVCGPRFTLTLDWGGPFHILRNLVFMGLAVLTWTDARPPGPDSDFSSTTYPERHSTAPQESDDGKLSTVQ